MGDLFVKKIVGTDYRELSVNFVHFIKSEFPDDLKGFKESLILSENIDSFINSFTEEEGVGVAYDYTVVEPNVIGSNNDITLIFIMVTSEDYAITTRGSVNKTLNSVISFGDICLKLKELYTEKNRRYGNSFHKQFEEFGLTASVIRLNDKMERLKSLNKNPSDCGDEPIEDTLKDLANYAIMTLMELSNK